MISTDFAPNEFKDDAMLAMRLFLQPWKWHKGREVRELKKMLLVKFFSKKNHIVFFLTARSALYHLLQIASLPKNSEIIVQGFTCEAVILPILANNLKPVYVDINVDDYSMNNNDLLKKISPQTRVIILQHTFGISPLQRNEILTTAKQHNILVIEDIAHGFPTNFFKNDKHQTIKLMSFGRSKAFSSVFGGAVITQNKSLFNKLESVEKKLSAPTSRFIAKLLLYKILAVFIKMTYTIHFGKLIYKLWFNSALFTPEITKKEKSGIFDFYYSKSYPNALAKLMTHQLKKYTQTSRNRLKISDYYSDHTKQNINCNVPFIRFPMLISDREKILQLAGKNHIRLGNWYDQPIAPKPISLAKMQYEPGSCPTAETVCESIVNIPTNVSIKTAEYILTKMEL